MLSGEACGVPGSHGDTHPHPQTNNITPSMKHKSFRRIERRQNIKCEASSATITISFEQYDNNQLPQAFTMALQMKLGVTNKTTINDCKPFLITVHDYPASIA